MSRPKRSFLLETPRFFRHLITHVDGDTYTPSRVYWLLAVVTQLFLSVWSVAVQGQEFSVTDFGTGMGLILAAGSAGVWITRKTEPDK